MMVVAMAAERRTVAGDWNGEETPAGALIRAWQEEVVNRDQV
jgi:hypothetical protein